MISLFGNDDEETDEEPEQKQSDENTETTEEKSHADKSIPMEEIQAIKTRMDDLEGEEEQNAAAIQEMHEKMDRFDETLESVDNALTSLIGMYDVVTAEANPFADSPGEGFNVVSGQVTPPSRKQPKQTQTEQDQDQDQDQDLHEPPEITEALEETNVGGDEQLSKQPTQSEANQAPSQAPSLSGVPETLSADVVILQWLSMLVEVTDPTTTLKALAYYENIGVLPEPTYHYLTSFLSGPGIDTNVDPEQQTDVSNEIHAISYEFISKLDELHQEHN